MHMLVIRHIDQSDPPQFQVVRLRDGKSTDGAVVPLPVGYPVEGRPNSDLMQELRWYLEVFLDYPFPPETDHAERVLDALKRWGKQAFEALFESGHGRDWFQDATRAGLDQLHLRVSSDDPKILAWPWEALCDPESSVLALGCQIERRLNLVADPLPLSECLPQDRVNILLVISRPFEADVRYRSISRPLVELIETYKLPAQVNVLRPPTLDRLREHLRERPNTYHILHFDGHGGYGEPTGGAPAPYALQGPQGCLVFETEDGRPDPIPAETLGVLLREHRIPAVVLNACQSAMTDEWAEDAFASVAASLIKAGIRSIVAMAYALYVSGAQRFLPAFYRRLFEAGDIAQATRAGCQEMYAHPGRVCARGTFPLQDWLVPVVYQQEAMDFSFAAQAKPAPSTDQPALPDEARDEENPYGLVGRDWALLAMERAMHRPPAGILVAGLGGVGKTTLARGFVHWLVQTEGLGQGCFWFTFNEIRSAEFVINRMGEALFGPDFILAPMERKIERLVGAFREHRYLLVWDNFESARGIEGTSVGAMLSAGDQELLKRFLHKLRGGKTRVILTSRSEEDWLGPTHRFKIDLRGLGQEERWELCQVILRDLGITIDRDDPDLVRLMDALDGHPLMMRVMLPLLEDRSAGQLVAALQTNLKELGLKGEEAHEKLLATLRLAEQSLPAELKPLLTPLALHERFIDADSLEFMARQVEDSWTRERIDQFLGALSVAGLVRDRGQAIYELHPALTGFLRSERPGLPPAALRDAWTRAFVDVMGSLADALVPRPPHEQRLPFHLHETSFHVALGEAEHLGMEQHFAALIQALAVYAQNTRNFGPAEALFLRLADHCQIRGDQEGEAVAYHQLGRIAEERRDFEAAEGWYQKSLAISEKQSDEHGAASTYHQLGSIAEERRDLGAAEGWYRKSLAISEKQGNEHGAAGTYHQLGRIAGLREQYEESGEWLIKAVVAFRRQRDAAWARQSVQNFTVSYHRATPAQQAKLREMWDQAGLGTFPEDPGPG